jgi:hypothetical protein
MPSDKERSSAAVWLGWCQRKGRRDRDTKQVSCPSDLWQLPEGKEAVCSSRRQPQLSKLGKSVRAREHTVTGFESITRQVQTLWSHVRCEVQCRIWNLINLPSSYLCHYFLILLLLLLLIFIIYLNSSSMRINLEPREENGLSCCYLSLLIFFLFLLPSILYYCAGHMQLIFGAFPGNIDRSSYVASSVS